MLWEGNLTERDVDYLKRAIKVVTPVADISLDVPEALVPAAPADPAGLERLKKEHGLGTSVDRLLAALPGTAAGPIRGGR